MDRFTSFDGVEIAYQTWGAAGALPPVILHHGFIVDANFNWGFPGDHLSVVLTPQFASTIVEFLAS